MRLRNTMGHQDPHSVLSSLQFTLLLTFPLQLALLGSRTIKSFLLHHVQSEGSSTTERTTGKRLGIQPLSLAEGSGVHSGAFDYRRAKGLNWLPDIFWCLELLVHNRRQLCEEVSRAYCLRKIWSLRLFSLLLCHAVCWFSTFTALRNVIIWAFTLLNSLSAAEPSDRESFGWWL